MKVLNLRPEIQILRGLAVLAVVLFHFNPQVFSLGYLGVDVFFVISGYLITPKIVSIFNGDRNNSQTYSLIKKFILKRFYRLIPAMATCVGTTLVLFMIFGSLNDLNRFLKQALYSLFFVANLGAYKTSGDYFNPDSNPLTHMWSLSLEFQYYMFLPIILYISHKMIARTNQLIVSLNTIAILLFLSLALFIFPQIELNILRNLYNNVTDQFLYYSPFSRSWQFLFGGIVCLYFESPDKNISIKPQAWFVRKSRLLLFVVVTSILLTKTTFHYQHLIISLASIVLILSRFQINIFLAGFFIWIGNRSYSLYLFHFPLQYFFSHSQILGPLRVSQVILFSTYLTALLSLSHISYEKIENKFKYPPKNSISIKTLLTIFIFIPAFISIALLSQSKTVTKVLYQEVVLPDYGGRTGSSLGGFMDQQCIDPNMQGDSCYFNLNGKTKKLILLGDSRAEQYFKTISELSKSNNFGLIAKTHPGCRFSLFKDSTNGQIDACYEKNQETLKLLSEVNPHMVIISQAIYPNENTDELLNSILKIKSLYPNLLVIGNNPVFPDDIDFMQPRSVFAGKYTAPRYYKTSEIDDIHIQVSNYFMEQLTSVGVDSINPVASFCSELVCSRWKNQSWLYYDTGHLSTFGADLIQPEIATFLQKYQKSE